MKNKIGRKNVFVDTPNYTPLAEVKQLDDAILYLSLYKGNLPLDVTGQTLSLRIKKSNGETEEQTTNITINSSNVDIDLKNSVFSIAGHVNFELNIKDTDGAMTTASFFIIVKPKEVTDEAIETTQQFDTLTKAIKQAQEVAIGGVSETAILNKVQELADEGKLNVNGIDQDQAIDYMTLKSSETSDKLFRLRVDDSGILYAVELDSSGNELTKNYNVLTSSDGTILIDNEGNVLLEEE